MRALVRPDGVPLPVQFRKFPQDHIAYTILVPGRKPPFEDELAIRWWIYDLTGPGRLSQNLIKQGEHNTHE